MNSQAARELPGAIGEFHRRLHEWYGQHGRRDLPWRNTDDAYAIYVSEVMLQQTQVKTVLERFYFPFLERFPSLEALARATQEEVLGLWQGLGYYNRAINLHKAAQSSGGQLPQTVEGLMSLPGIGRNTAHAVAAFACRQPVAVMEANVKRVVSRIFALETPSEAELWDKATLLLDREFPFDYNQAMMDIGAMVCTVRAPACNICPANLLCLGKKSPESYPAAKSRKAPPVRPKRIAVFRNSEGHYYASPRDSRFLNGLYHFTESESEETHLIFQGRRYALDKGKLGHIRQQYSHFTLEADIYLIGAGTMGGKHWHSLAQLKRLPFSMAEKKILALLAEPKTAKPKSVKKVKTNAAN